MERHLHIVSFNVPWPADYGGVIDVFYRLKALSEAGVKVHLHCFTYGRAEAAILEELCEEVYYYRRDMSPLRFLNRRPFIVSSRDNKILRQRLLKDHYPILLEGLHCCSLLEDDEVVKGRVVMVRAHNIEADYYGRLAKSERNLFRRIYLHLEANRIRRYEPVLRRATAVLAISKGDKETLERMGCRHVLLVSGSTPFPEVSSMLGKGDYVLYHGNLEVAENYNAVNYFLDNVITETRYPFVVAGQKPPKWLRDKIARHQGVTLVDSPNDGEMQRLIAEAQVNVLVTQQPTGLKIKLLNALFTGRHCLVNSGMVAGTELASLCTVADTPEALREQMDRLMEKPFDADMLSIRQSVLLPYSTSRAIRPLLNLLESQSL